MESINYLVGEFHSLWKTPLKIVTEFSVGEKKDTYTNVYFKGYQIVYPEATNRKKYFHRYKEWKNLMSDSEIENIKNESTTLKYIKLNIID